MRNNIHKVSTSGEGEPIIFRSSYQGPERNILESGQDSFLNNDTSNAMTNSQVRFLDSSDKKVHFENVLGPLTFTW